MSDYSIVPNAALTATADAIRTKSGSQATIEFDHNTGFKDAVDAIPTGGGESEDNVIFIDYDGTVVESYTTAELLAMSALPSNPSHAGLTAQGWNWSLSDAKAYVTANPTADLIIGQVYVPTDGKTHLNICIESGFDVSIPFIVKFANSIGANIEIDWGDGSSKAYATGTSEMTPVAYSHVYSSVGEYDVTLNVISGTLIFYGAICGTSTDGNEYINRRRYKKAFIGNNAKHGSAVVFRYTCLEEITIPASFDYGISSFVYFLTGCYNLTGLVLPSGITEIGDSLVASCASIEYVSLPNGVSTIGASSFRYCYNLKKVCIPSSVTSIGNYFIADSGIKKIVVPGGVTTIGSYFAQYGLCEVAEFPSSLTSIGAIAFANCKALKSVALNEGLTNIPNSFVSSTGLRSITYPSTVTSIGTTQFTSSAVKEVHLRSTTPPTISNKSNIAMSDYTGLYYVPYSSDHSVLNAYKTATNWSNYADQIIEEPQS